MILAPTILDDLDRTVQFEDYARARQALYDACRNFSIPEESISFYGNVGFPGISDIDALVLADPARLKSLISYLNTHAWEAKFSYLFWHPPLLITKDFLPYLPDLHTIVGLDCTHLEEIRRSSVLGEEGLNLVWFTFLHSTVVNVLRSKNVSLRLLALLHKNLEFTSSFFSGSVDTALEISSTQYRRLIWERNDSSYLELAWTIFISRFKSTCAIVDCYLQTHDVVDRLGVPPTRLQPSPVGRTLTVKAGRQTTCEKIGGLAFATATVQCKRLADSFLSGKDGSGPWFDYMRAIETVEQIASQARLPFPFITPFCIPPAPAMKRQLRRWSTIHLLASRLPATSLLNPQRA